MKQAPDKHRESNRRHYETHKETVKLAVKARQQAGYSRLFLYKQGLVCENCGFSHPAALDFHHRNPAEKTRNVSQMVQGCSWSRVLAEIEKCTILCANCHRILHHNTRLTGDTGITQPSEG